MSIEEKFVYEIWKENKFIKELTTEDQQRIEIVDPGTHNNDSAGPDFINARIKFDNITYLGDVEIDTWHSDWKTHGHSFDKKYNKVILHVVISKDKYQPLVFSKDGRKIHSIYLLDFIDENIHKAILNAVETEKKNRVFDMPCLGRNDSVHKKEKLDFLFELGVVRFNKKSKRLLERLKEMIYLKEMNIREPVLKYDFGNEYYNKKYSPNDFSDIQLWEQLIYEMIFEALGYSRNKDIMVKVAKTVNVTFLNNFISNENFEEIVESALFNVSGLLPSSLKFIEETTADYVRKSVELWNLICVKYDGTTYQKEDWNFFKHRPQNFPTIRLSGGAHLICHILKNGIFKNLIEVFKEEKKEKEITVILRNLMIIEGQGYWASHYNFDKISKEKLNYFIGISRADEIIINVLFPVLYIYFDIFNEKESVRKLKNHYVNYTQHGTNRLVEQVESTLGLANASRRSINYQAMIELFRNYCVKERCLECKIGKKVFN
jgi:hypothetical protein